MDELPEFKPVKLHCTDSDCENGEHCYRPKRGQWKKLGDGRCMHCGDTSVDMELTREYRTAEIPAIFEELRKEHIRAVHFEKPLDARAKRLIRRDGYEGVRAKARGRLKSRVGDPGIWDGRQTPFDGDILNFAQHATATCCRKCMRYWYGFNTEGQLDRRKLDFCEEMLLTYLEDRKKDIRAAEAPEGKAV